MYSSSDLSRKSHLPLVLLLLVLWTLLLSDHGDCLKFDFPTFLDGDEKFFIKRNSSIVLNAIQVTPDVNGARISNLAGRIWYYKPLKLWRNINNGKALASFNSTFVLNINPQTIPGGEGLAFILTGGNNHDLPENSQGQWLGIVNSTLDGDPQNEIVAVEFDTRKSFEKDIDSNHVGLDVNSIDSINQVSLGNGVNLSAAVDITARVQYDGAKKILSVFVNNTQKNPILSVQIDLSSYLPKNIFVGFSASTSNATELNCVKKWAFDGPDMDEKPSLIILWVLILTGGGGAVVVFICGLVWYRRIRDGGNDDENLGIENQIEGGGGVGPKKMRLRELRKATGNFSSKNKLGQGGFGTVYRGRLANQVEVAVKRTTKKVQQGRREFLAEVLTIGGLHHKNLVKLIGWCYEGRELLIVYDYMPNGSLDKLIYHGSGSVLNRERRFSIIRGVAEAVEYLHHGCEKRVLHRDIKASNVMLDSEFNARLGDFGLARRIHRREEITHHSTVEIAGTPGYMAPESFLTGRATVEMDVYSFGVLVMAVVCGRQPDGYGDVEEANNIVYWVWELHRRGSIISAVDSRLLLVGDEEEEMMRRLLFLGLACCHPNPNERPSMRMVLQILEGEAPPPLVPAERPAFVWPAATCLSLKGNVDFSSVADVQLTLITQLVGR